MKYKEKKYDPDVKCLYCNDVLGIQCKCITPAVDEKGVAARRHSDAVAEHFRNGGKKEDMPRWD